MRPDTNRDDYCARGYRPGGDDDGDGGDGGDGESSGARGDDLGVTQAGVQAGVRLGRVNVGGVELGR